MYHSILKGDKIEFYMIYHEDFQKEVKGLLGYHNVSASISCKIIEECCIKDYLMRENGNYPDWNVQEQGKDWPFEIKVEHSNITKKSLKRKRKRKNVNL